ncbi:MAG: RluA family pseudouridine synthase [Candidatus Binatia bacterium]
MSARFVVRAEDAGKRLDVLLAERVTGLSRRRARVLISAGSVFVDAGRVLVHSRRIAAGREVSCHLGAFVSARPDALDPRRVLHEDASLVAIDKPAGMPSHPTMARRQGTALQLTEEWLRRRGGEKVPLWPLHRLDAGTSGVLLFAKSRRAARAVSQNLARRRVRKVYLALVTGVPEPAEGEISVALSEGWLRSAPSATGKEATTRYRVVEELPGAAVLEVEPLTGRMHQIRVHLASIGHPVLGDTKYSSGATTSAPRLFLHAARIELPHPEGGRPFAVESALPAEWIAFARDRSVRDDGCA